MSTPLSDFNVYVGAGKSTHRTYNLPQIMAFLPKTPQTILDAGCGDGWLAAKLAENGHKVIGVDVTQPRIDLAKSQYPNASFYCRNVYDDLTDILPAGGVDISVSCEVIEHLYSPDEFLDGIRKATRRNGSIIITTPYHGYLKNLLIGAVNGWDEHFGVHHKGGHIKFFSKSTLSDMLSKHGFTDIEFNAAGRAPFLWKSMVLKARRM